MRTRASGGCSPSSTWRRSWSSWVRQPRSRSTVRWHRLAPGFAMLSPVHRRTGSQTPLTDRPPLLAGVRVIERLAARARADVDLPVGPRCGSHQGRAAPGRLHPPDDLANRGGCLPPAPPHPPGKRSITLDLRQPEAVEVYKDLVRGADAVVEAMRPGALARRGLGYDDLREVNPKIVFCAISVRRDRPVPGPAEPRHRLRHLGRPHPAGAGRGRVHPPPGDAQHRHQRRAHARGGRAAGRDHSGTETGEGCAMEIAQSDAAIHGLVSDRDVEGLRAPRGRGHRQPVRRLRAPSAGPGRHARGRPLPDLRVGGRPRAVRHPSRRSGRTSPRASDGSSCSNAGPARSTPTTPGATSSSRQSLRRSSAQRAPRTGWRSVWSTTCPSHRSTTASRWRPIPSSSTACRSTGSTRWGPSSCRCP